MKKKFLFLILMLCLFVMPVMAEETVTNCIGSNDMNCGEVKYDDDLYFNADDSVSYNKNANGTVLLAGNVVAYDGSNKGLAMLAGNSVKSKGYSEYALVAGNDLSIQASVIEKDAFIAGNIINVDATIYRDAVIAGANVKVYGHVGRNLSIYASEVILDNVTIDGNVNIMAGTITIKDNVKITGKLTYGATNKDISSDAVIGSIEETEVHTYEFTFLDTLKGRAISYASLLLELSSQVIKQNDDSNIYDILVAALTKIDEGYDPMVISDIVSLKYLEYLGVMPSLDKCSICGSNKSIATLSSDAGGLVCNSCRTNEPIVSEKAIKLVRMLYYVDIAKISNLDISDSVKLEVHNFIDRYYDRYTGIYFKTKKLLKVSE